MNLEGAKFFANAWRKKNIKLLQDWVICEETVE